MLKDMIYPNLKKEMDRKAIKIKDIAKHLEVSEKTVRNYFNGITPIHLKFAIKIQNEFFEKIDLLKLFEERND